MSARLRRVRARQCRPRSYAEVSAETGVPVGTLRTRAFYGLKALRLVLDEMGVQLWLPGRFAGGSQ